MNEELLRGCFKQLRGRAAAGIDGVTKVAYAEHVEENLTALVERLHRLAYVPQRVRRVYIPKPGSTKGRPLGIPCLEDKMVQPDAGRKTFSCEASDSEEEIQRQARGHQSMAEAQPGETANP